MRTRPELREYAVRIDDGFTGSNFERPSFKKMLEDVKAGRTNCIIVKDLSRFGRDYLTVEDYISRVFPFLGVRFISVNDGFDSINPQDIDSLDTSFRTLIYDLYSRDLSCKVKSAKKARAER
ncbi:MAG: recombinase family protein, partial [Clostridiales bacterium]|nr:recombinase family protein [Clostridiales bacterium]